MVPPEKKSTSTDACALPSRVGFAASKRSRDVAAWKYGWWPVESSRGMVLTEKLPREAMGSRS